MHKETWNYRQAASAFFALLLERYWFTLLFGAVILATTLIYNLALPQDQYCVTHGWATLYAYLTSPFNIGCEADLMSVGSNEGGLRFIGNFTIPLVLAFIAETTMRSWTPVRKRNVFLSAITASYGVCAFSSLLAGGNTVGTSIIGISMVLFLIYRFLDMGLLLQKRKNRFVAFLAYAAAIFFIGIGYLMYSPENWIGHAAGGALFILIALGFDKNPDMLATWIGWFNSARQRIMSR